MRKLSDGSTLVIRRSQGGYSVEHIAVSGITAATFDCDTLGEARAALHYGPDRW